MVIDHLGVVVRTLADGIQEWERLFGYRVATEAVTNSRQKVRVVFLVKEGSVTVKLVEPTDESSPVFRLARRGGGLHHVCFRCREISAGVASLVKEGARLLVPPEPGEAFDGNRIAFLFTHENVNVELIDTAEKAGWVDIAPQSDLSASAR